MGGGWGGVLQHNDVNKQLPKVGGPCVGKSQSMVPEGSPVAYIVKIPSGA